MPAESVPVFTPLPPDLASGRDGSQLRPWPLAQLRRPDANSNPSRRQPKSSTDTPCDHAAPRGSVTCPGDDWGPSSTRRSVVASSARVSRVKRGPHVREDGFVARSTGVRGRWRRFVPGLSSTPPSWGLGQTLASPGRTTFVLTTANTSLELTRFQDGLRLVLVITSSPATSPVSRELKFSSRRVAD
jgi:hypothetical protein